MSNYEKIRGLLMEAEAKRLEVSEVTTEGERRKSKLQSKLMTNLALARNDATTPSGKKDPGAQERLKAAQEMVKAVSGKHRKTKVRSGRHATQTDVTINK